jgi:hypothetical protein
MKENEMDGHAERKEMKNVYRVLVVKPEGKR